MSEAIELKLRGGTTAENAAFTGASKEVSVDTDKNTLIVHDGITAGGHPLAPESASTAQGTSYDATDSDIDAVNVKEALDTIPTVPPKPESGAYTLQKQDKGKHISATGSGDITVPANVFDAGDVVIIYNNTTSDRNIVRGTGVTMFWFDGVDADRSLAQRGLANIFCVGPDTFVISGQGVL